MTEKIAPLAFPSHGSMGEVIQYGMTLRDYFAIHAPHEELNIPRELTINAVNAYLGTSSVYGDYPSGDWRGRMYAKARYDFSDAMLKERLK